MRTVHEVSEIAGVTVRTLHHYDNIGILKPTAVSESGYRLYDDSALQRLMDIMMLRELDFSLGDIEKILDNPNFDRKQAMIDQIEMLKLKRKRIDGLISRIENIIKDGAENMNFNIFNKDEEEKFAQEAKQRWGKTNEYATSMEKRSHRTDAENRGVDAGLMRIFAEFGKMKTEDAATDNPQALVDKLRRYISDKYYPCEKTMLMNLGMMYVSDERFKKNIDAVGGEGTAEFAAKAIQIFCNM